MATATVGPALAGRFMGALVSVPAGFALRLLKRQHVDAIGVGDVVGRGEGVRLVTLAAEVKPLSPSSSAFLRPAVADVQARVDFAPVGLPTGLQPLSRGAAA
jgi:hypothetical protein